MDEGQGVLNFSAKVSHEAKLKELLHRLTSVEIKLCSDATKEFVKVLKGDDGGELLRQYVRASPRCSELLDALKLRQGKEGMSYIFELIANLLSHHEGKYKSNDAELVAISRDLDKFARSLVTENLGDVYKELNSKEAKRQKAALLLMASIVRRGPSLASEVSKCFDFKLAGFTKLAEQKWKENEKLIKNSLRKSFVGFAMSFLEVGKPGLLRWVLQQKEMYSGVLRGLGNDDDETVIYVLSTLRDRVLVEEALVSPALRSVLFGNVTLEQLINICGRDGGGPTAELAYNLLVLVCTDPCNGLMPDLTKRPIPLRGNTKRIMGLMKKLNATEIQYHRDLLLAIVNSQPSFGLSYLEEFPYNLEDYMSPSWFAAVSLAASLVSLIVNGPSREFINSQLNDLNMFGNMDVQRVMKCMFPRPFSRSMINKGLLHTDFLVKHGTLRLLLELLKFLDSLISASNCRSSSTNQSMQPIIPFKQEIQNDVQALLPDPQVLLNLLSSLDRCSKTHDSCLKRTGSHLKHHSRRIKKLKMDTAERDIAIVVGGISSVSDVPLSVNGEGVSDAPRADVLDDEEDLIRIVRKIWGLEMCSLIITTPKEVANYLHSKLLDALKYFHRIVPHALGGSFEFFIGLLSNPLELPVDLQVSLLSLLMEYIEWHPNNEIPLRTPPILYKHLQSFIKLLIFSTVNSVRHQAYRLAKAAIFSTGAFDRNLHEIEAWLLFLPGHQRNKSSANSLEVEALHSLCSIVISFLCDAVSTVGNNLVKYWDLLKSYVHSLEGVGDLSLDFSPLITCVMEKCLRLIHSKSGTYSLPEKSMVLLYMCNTVKFLLQTQVDAELLSALLNKQLTERLGGFDENEEFLCEWNSLKNFWLFVRSISQQHGGCHFCNDRSIRSNSSFTSTLGEIERFLSNGCFDETPGIAIAFISSILCVEVDEVLMNMPKLVIISHNLQGIPLSILSSVFFLDHSALFRAFELWPQMFCAGLDMAVSDLSGSGNNTAAAGINCNQLFDTTEVDAAAFSLFLKQAPFHLLFPATMCMKGPCSSELSKMQELLFDKLSECTSHCSLLNLRLILHWTHQIQSYHNLNPSVEIEQLSHICLVLVRKLLAKLLVSECSSDCAKSSGSCPLTHKMHEVAKVIFTHPSVLMSLSFPLGNVQNFASNIENSFDGLNVLFGEEVYNCCSPIINILTITLDYVWSISSTHISASEARDVTYKELVRLFKALQHRLFLEVKDRFDQSVCMKNLTPLLQTVYPLHALVQFLSPFLLLELVDWMFSRVELDDWMAKNTALSVGCSLAAGAFSALSYYLRQQIRDMLPYDLFWEICEKGSKAHIFEKIYSKVVDFAISSEIDCADKCLLEAVSALYGQKHIQQQNFHPLLLAMCRIIMITPVEIISCCIYKTNIKKAKFLFILTEMSSLHSSIFGQLFMNLLSRILDHDSGLTGRSFDLALSEDHFLLLLPACLSYLNSISLRLGEQNRKEFKHVPYFYSRILLKGFSQWKNFVSKDIFEEDYGEFFPLSLNQLLCLVDGSLLGKSLQILRHHFALNGHSMTLKKRLKLFKQIFPNSASHDELLDCNCQVIDCYSLHWSLNVINRIVAKISLCKILLFHEEVNGDLKVVSSAMGRKIGTSRIRFINILVDIWHFIVMKFSLASDQSVTRKSRNISSLYNRLEVFVLRNILGLTVEILDDLIQMESIPFLEQLFRSALLYRFHDPVTVKILRVLLTQLYGGKLSYDSYLQLLLAHSQFASTIHSACKLTHSFPSDYYLKPVPSILKCLVFPSLDHYESDRPCDEKKAELSSGRLEIIKLLRTLLLKNAHQSGSGSGCDSDINYKELHSLLCDSYGATLSQIDLDIWKLIQEIECISKSVSESILNAVCLWGTTALKVKIDHPSEQYSSNIKVDSQETREWSTSQLREDSPIDPDTCISTVLFFPYDRSTSDELLFVTKIQPDNVGERVEIYSSNVQVRKQYDPAFILRFSIHILSKGFVEPVDFAKLRLLAIAFVSMSSPDLGIRKSAYETLGIFKNALECQKRKDVVGLRLLLTTVQNSIEEPWQRIPSVIALFVAEASCILLNSSHDHFAAISKLLTHSSKLNLRVIPLFDDFLWSTSVNFKAERLWMLRLVYAGLNSDDDALLYIRNSILESLLSFYMSPLSDFESKELVMEVIQKSVKLHKIACHLVKHCSLFSWFSSLISVIGERFNGGEERFFLKQALAILKAVNDVISWGSISKWLQNFALEQLAELSSNLFNYILHDATLMVEAVALLNPLLQMIVSLLKISQKRKTCQPHFTLSMEGLFKIYQVVGQFNLAHINPELALEAILMNGPPVSIFLMHEERLESFLKWAISTALQSESSRKLMSNESQVYSMKESGDVQRKNSLLSKFLRWLTASVIIGKLYQKYDYMDAKFFEPQNFNSLYSLLLHIENVYGRRDEIRIAGEELLASTIFSLQLLLGVNCEVLPSVVSALCLLLFNASDSAVGKTDLLQDNDSLISSLCSRIQCPPEANPAWRWSFYQPWKDLSLEPTDVQMMEQYHACQILLLIISNVLGGRKLESANLSHIDIETSDVFKWERSLLENDS
ncbi:uncharacterized protein LOC129319197 isoform X2 [Prosopis cineraria]|uniref:uncharacterized protein LOC129319197 isoform X2 n=1 Tax=Prosopis cineraria TaxID=364024 RepID=UPI00240F06D9|nr:uncharacterized protein LOC129319197 isoform X2 [Prosopis cineraria]